MLATAALAGCGSAAAGPPVLNFYTSADGASQYAKAAQNCTNDAGGRYQIVQRTGPKSTDDQRLQLARRLTAGDPSVDIVSMDVTWTTEFAAAGWIIKFPPDVAAKVTQGTLPTTVATATVDGAMYAAPLNTNTQILWYRKDLAPTPPATWDEMIKDSEALADKGLPSYIEAQGAQYEGISVWFNTLVASGGGQIVGENGDVLVDKGDAAQKAMSIMQQVADAKGSDPSLSVNKENDGRLAMEGGTAAFQVNYPFVYPSMFSPPPDGGGGGTYIDAQGKPSSAPTDRRVKDEFAWAPYPSVVAGQPAKVTIGGLNIGVSSTSPHKDLALEAVQCIRDARNQKQLAIGAGVPPTLESLYSDPDFQKQYPAWQAIKASLDTASVRPKTPAYQSISTLLADRLNPPAQIDPQTLPGELAGQIVQAQKSEGLVP